MKFSRLLEIINEELSDFYDYDAEQSMADRYFEKRVAAPTEIPKVKINAELVGYVDRQYTHKLQVPIPVYLNPKSLEGFSSECRGVLVSNGNFYLAISASAMHDNILEMLGEKGIVPYGKTYQYWKNFPDEFIAVQRYAKTDQFVQSSAYDEFPEFYQELFDMANAKQPYQFKYIEDDNLNEMESPLDPNFQTSYLPQGYEHNILDEKR